jgi:hypothetical protein
MNGVRAFVKDFFSFCLDPSQSGITLISVVIKFGLNYSREVKINYPMEYGNAIIVPPFASYKRGDSFLVMSPPFLIKRIPLCSASGLNKIKIHFDTSQLCCGVVHSRR